MFSVKKRSGLFLLGGTAYALVEVLWRGKTHWSMLLTGGMCFISLYRAFAKRVSTPLWKKCLVGSSIITAYEYCSGCIFNRFLRLNVWDYSNMPFNLKGQICMLYSVLWGLLCIPVSFICKRIGNNSV